MATREWRPYRRAGGRPGDARRPAALIPRGRIGHISLEADYFNQRYYPRAMDVIPAQAGVFRSFDEIPACAEMTVNRNGESL